MGTAACAPSPDSSGFTVEYYREHAAERDAQLAACANDPGGLGDSRACINAREAARIEGIGSLKDLPPLGLPTREPQPGSEPEHEDGR